MQKIYSGDLHIQVKGEEWLLLPERAVYWERKNLLLVSDLHLAKSGHFRKAGIPLPSGIHEDDLQRLSSVIERVHADSLWILGDMFHSHENQEWEMWRRWKQKFPELKCSLVKGNHDFHDDQKFIEVGLDSVHPFISDPPFYFSHERMTDCESHYSVSGHIHPSLRMSQSARMSASFPCYWLAQEFAVLPAFGNFTGTSAIQPERTDRVYFIAGGKVLRAGNQPD